ncbi:PPC domain-containing protein [Myxococcus sp. RHSTA-1-4]|uniref:PPC domain-containing protein n=1 Tax=Myxococcus sp. RHSTA-1-4 TaxID=2874601 RepID=UPI001CBBBCF5|nr:PPC domain-containing protein [Myxococcus sp. RHSTA-1-4]MBZ4422575.1 PPC domain-containing protein [Myxococcus sp. RHSTA-1-4]
MMPKRLPAAFIRLLPCVLLVAACGPTDVADDSVACAGVRCTAGTCVSNGGQPMCRCGPWERAAGLSCAVGVFDVPDDHGGSPGDATVLSAPMSALTGRIDVSEREGMVDRDLFAITSGARHVYAFVCNWKTLPDCRLRLLAGSGNEVDTLQARSLDGPGRALFFTLDEGTAYVEVSSEKGVGTYTYQLQDLGLDDHGDDFAGATALQPSWGRSPFTVTHSGLHDQDVFTFRSQPGHGYRFGCELPAPTAVLARELELTLRRGASGTLVDSTSSFSDPSIGVGVLADREADWFVTVRVLRGNQWRLESSCWLEDLGPDDHANTLDGATPVTPGVPVPVTLHSDEDVDVLSFTAKAGRFYTLSSDPWGALGLRVVDASGREVASLIAPSFSFQVASDGTYFIQVREGASWLYDFLLLLVDGGLSGRAGVDVDGLRLK